MSSTPSSGAGPSWAPFKVGVPRSSSRAPHHVWIAAHDALEQLGLEVPGVRATSRWTCTDHEGDRWTFELRERGSMRVTDSDGRAMLGPRTLAGCVELAERHGARFPEHPDDVDP